MFLVVFLETSFLISLWTLQTILVVGPLSGSWWSMHIFFTTKGLLCFIKHVFIFYKFRKNSHLNIFYKIFFIFYLRAPNFVKIKMLIFLIYFWYIFKVLIILFSAVPEETTETKTEDAEATPEAAKEEPEAATETVKEEDDATEAKEEETEDSSPKKDEEKKTEE